MWLVKKLTALIGGKFVFSKKSLIRFALKYECCNFNQSEHLFVAGHMIYKLAYISYRRQPPMTILFYFKAILAGRSKHGVIVFCKNEPLQRFLSVHFLAVLFFIWQSHFKLLYWLKWTRPRKKDLLHIQYWFFV